MTTAILYLAGSTLALGIIAGVFRVEDARAGNRVILVRARGLLDRAVVGATDRLSTADTYLGRGFARLMLHYAAHGLLQRLLMLLGRVEKKVEYLLHSNKKVAKEIRKKKGKTHLDKIADHRAEVALSKEQKAKLRSHE
jgi:hypothetical protein